VKDAHKKFIEEIKALSATGKETLRGDLTKEIKKCIKASGGNPNALLKVMQKFGPVIQAVFMKNASMNVKKSMPLSSKFAKEKIDAVQSNLGT